MAEAERDPFGLFSLVKLNETLISNPLGLDKYERIFGLPLSLRLPTFIDRCSVK